MQRSKVEHKKLRKKCFMYVGKNIFVMVSKHKTRKSSPKDLVDHFNIGVETQSTLFRLKKPIENRSDL